MTFRHFLQFLLITVIVIPATTSGDISSLTKANLGKYGTVCDWKTGVPVNLGPTGATGWPRNREIVVTGVDRFSPADEILREGDIILAANGKVLEPDSRRSLGRAITESESFTRKGILNLKIWRADRTMEVIIKLPIMGDYSSNWPEDCSKSKAVLYNACEWLARNQLNNGLFPVCYGTESYTPCSVNGLLLLCSDDTRHLENARRLAYHLIRERNPKPSKTCGLANWAWSYSAIFLSEYYLLTGDANVLPFLQDLHKWITAGQTEAGSWSYGTNTSKPSEENQNQIGLACFLALVLMNDCGVSVNEKALSRSTGFFQRFVYTESIAYGDHRPWAQAGGSGKDALGAIIFRMLNDREASAYYANRVADLYPWIEEAPTGPYFSFLWSPLAARFAPEKRYRRFMDHWQWYYDLSRRWDGSFLAPPNEWTVGDQYTMRGPGFTTGGMAIAYALSGKRLQILGAPGSVFSKVKLSAGLQEVREKFIQKQWHEVEPLSKKLDGKISNSEQDYLAQLRKAAKQTQDSIELTLKSIEENIKRNDLPLAKIQADDLQMLMGSDDPRLAKIFEKLAKLKDHPVFQAEKEFQENRYLCSFDRQARAKMARLAASDSIGSLKQQAAGILADSARWPNYRNSFTAEEELNIYHNSSQGDAPDPVAVKVMDKLAHLQGRYWVQYEAKKIYNKTGLPGEGSIWDLLIRPMDLSPEKWCYLFPGKDDSPKNWQMLSFDDSAWNRAADLYAGVKHWNTNACRVVIRGTFELEKCDYDRLLVFCRTDTPADFYLNGELAGKFLRNTEGFCETFKLSESSAGLLRKGKNVIAISAASDSGGIAITLGLQGIRYDKTDFGVRPDWVLRTAEGPGNQPAVIPENIVSEYDMTGKTPAELLDLLGDESAMVRWFAAAAFAGQDEQSIPELRKRLLHENPVIRESSARALAYMGAMADPAIADLLDLLKNEENNLVKRAAVDSIGFIASAKSGEFVKCKETVQTLVGLLAHKDYKVRDSAAKALGNIGASASEAIPHLEKALKDNDWWVRESSAKALKSIDPSGKIVQPMLDKAAETETHRWVLKALGKPIEGVDMPLDVDKRNTYLRL